MGEAGGVTDECSQACKCTNKRIAQIRAMMEAVTAFTSGSNLAEDARLKGCTNACATMEGMLRNSGLAESLKEKGASTRGTA